MQHQGPVSMRAPTMGVMLLTLLHISVGLSVGSPVHLDITDTSHDLDSSLTLLETSMAVYEEPSEEGDKEAGTETAKDEEEEKEEEDQADKAAPDAAEEAAASEETPSKEAEEEPEPEAEDDEAAGKEDSVVEAAAKKGDKLAKVVMGVVKQKVKESREQRTAQEAAVLLTKAENVKIEDNSTASNQTVQVIKAKVKKWKDGILALKTKLSEASKQTEEAKKEAAAAMKVDESLKQELSTEQQKADKDAAEADQQVKEDFKKDTVNKKQLAKVAKQVQATEEEARIGSASIVSLLKAKTRADERYAKAKTKHSLEGLDDVPEGSPDSAEQGGLLKELSIAAKAKNIADKRYDKAKEKLQKAQDKAAAAMTKLKTAEAGPSLEAVKAAETAEEKAIRLEGTANAARLKALAVITDADSKAQDTMNKQEKLMHKVTQIKAKAETAAFRVEQVKERTQKLKVGANERSSKAEALRAMRKRAEDELNAQETDFSLETMANKIREAKSSHEAANKKNAIAQHTLTVMQKIDQAAKREARMIKSYQAKERKEKRAAGTLADDGARKLRQERRELQKVTDSIVNKNEHEK